MYSQSRVWAVGGTWSVLAETWKPQPILMLIVAVLLENVLHAAVRAVEKV